MGSRPQQERDDRMRYAPPNRAGASNVGPGAAPGGEQLPPGIESRSWPPDTALPPAPPPAHPPGRPLFGGLAGVPLLGIVGAVALLLILCVCGGAFVLLRIGNSPTATPDPALDAALTATVLTPDAASGPGAAAFHYGSLVTASAIDSTGRATNTTNVFTSTATIYTVLPIYNVITGTAFFARWRHDDQVYEDSPAIMAPQAWEYNFVEFHLQSLPAKPFPPGNYTVQIYINGLPGPTSRFVVQ
jgi:hypothetical protein